MGLRRLDRSLALDQSRVKRLHNAGPETRLGQRYVAAELASIGGSDLLGTARHPDLIVRFMGLVALLEQDCQLADRAGCAGSSGFGE